MQFTYRWVCLATVIAASTTCCHGQMALRSGESSLPFRSELWQQEYRKAKKDRNIEDPLVDLDTSSSQGPKSKSGAIAAENQDDSSLAQHVDHAAIPGQAALEDLQKETPIAEWQVDRQLTIEADQGNFRDAPTAWQLSKSAGRDVPAVELSKGPTMTTYLVGFMACIVVGGALMTGREA